MSRRLDTLLREIRACTLCEAHLPLGPFGELFHPLLVEPKLRSIFAYRRSALERIFPEHHTT